MIFPGMDPYLEDPQLWPGVHSRLIVYLADQLQPLLEPRYVAAVEERVFVEGPDRQVIPDITLQRGPGDSPKHDAAVAEVDPPVVVQVPELEVHESLIEIVDLHSDRRVVTVIEATSPSNKYPGPGRESYRAKQREVLASTSHLVEIDLLRTGDHVLAVPEWAARGRGDYDYLVCTNRAEGLRDRFDLYPRRLRERLPRVAIPLANGDADVPLDIQSAVARVYDAGAYENRIDYGAPCRPPLGPEDQAWVNEQTG
jgi:hypothetical protein